VCGRTDGGDGQPCGGARPCPSPEYPSAGIPLMHTYVVPVVVTCTVLGCAVGVMWGRNHNRVWCGGRWAQDGTLRDRHQRRRQAAKRCARHLNPTSQQRHAWTAPGVRCSVLGVWFLIAHWEGVRCVLTWPAGIQWNPVRHTAPTPTATHRHPSGRSGSYTIHF
jgi:hypothetical protein